MPDDDQIAQKSGSECTNVTIYVNKEKKISNGMLRLSFNKVVEQVQVHFIIHGFSKELILTDNQFHNQF